jgi:3-deoxy-D-manno-octulosonic-acid transferase
MHAIALALYNLVFPLLFLLYLPFYLVKLNRRGGFADGFGERFGLYKAAKRQALSALHRPVWIHAVSVGETQAALSMITAWQARDPQQHFVLSTTTSTGQAIAREKVPAGVVVIYFPLDCLLFCLRSFSLIQPAALVIVEVEIWPTMVATARLRGVPVALVNCRMSDNSAAGYAKHRWFFGDVFRGFDVIAVQTEEDAHSGYARPGPDHRLQHDEVRPDRGHRGGGRTRAVQRGFRSGRQPARTHRGQYVGGRGEVDGRRLAGSACTGTRAAAGARAATS